MIKVSTKSLDIIQEYNRKIKHLRIIAEKQNPGYQSILGNHWRKIYNALKVTQ
ncbi:hypothetical protein [Leuconostoc citreum]|uniref:hypothetical protein n=1 Tax=Leuconostoc citreum TaxID=33964 RepID=UPI0018E2506E|nr:hypothetical protein [Leuconostoc citreum]